MLSSMAIAQNRGNVGFGFGVNFQEHQKTNLKQAGLTYFRLYLKAEDVFNFFLHSDTGSFMVEEGIANTEGTKDSQALGTSIDLGLINLDLMVGRSTIHVNNVAGAVPIDNGTVATDLDTTDPFAEIGIRYSYTKNTLSLDVAYSYRHHVTNSQLNVNGKNINKFSAQGLSVGLSYLF
jgi:opacity protein-like surface antigen